jgi:uridylate kinase
MFHVKHSPSSPLSEQLHYTSEPVRLLLKITGDFFNFEDVRIIEFCQEIKSLDEKVSWVFVVGGGNRMRGKANRYQNAPQSVRDALGMCSSVLNGIELQAILATHGIDSFVVGPFEGLGVVQTWGERQKNLLNSKHVIPIFAGGLGQPFFSTDMSAVLNALKTGCAAILKGTKVSGVFDKDPDFHKDAQLITETCYSYMLEKKLKVVDMPAVALAQDYDMPMGVFCLRSPGSLVGIWEGTTSYTWVSGAENTDV